MSIDQRAHRYSAFSLIPSKLTIDIDIDNEGFVCVHVLLLSLYSSFLVEAIDFLINLFYFPKL